MDANCGFYWTMDEEEKFGTKTGFKAAKIARTDTPTLFLWIPTLTNRRRTLVPALRLVEMSLENRRNE